MCLHPDVFITLWGTHKYNDNPVVHAHIRTFTNNNPTKSFTIFGGYHGFFCKNEHFEKQNAHGHKNFIFWNAPWVLLFAMHSSNTWEKIELIFLATNRFWLDQVLQQYDGNKFNITKVGHKSMYGYRLNQPLQNSRQSMRNLAKSWGNIFVMPPLLLHYKNEKNGLM